MSCLPTNYHKFTFAFCFVFLAIDIGCAIIIGLVKPDKFYITFAGSTLVTALQVSICGIICGKSKRLFLAPIISTILALMAIPIGGYVVFHKDLWNQGWPFLFVIAAPIAILQVFLTYFHYRKIKQSKYQVIPDIEAPSITSEQAQKLETLEDDKTTIQPTSLINPPPQQHAMSHCKISPYGQVNNNNPIHMAPHMMPTQQGMMMMAINPSSPNSHPVPVFLVHPSAAPTASAIYQGDPSSYAGIIAAAAYPSLYPSPNHFDHPSGIPPKI